jgi:hypothetical protein
MSAMSVSDIVKISGFDSSFDYLGVNNSLISIFTGAIESESLRYIEFGLGTISEFNPSEQLPQTLIYLNLSNNNLYYFNPTTSLPVSLIEIGLQNNLFTDLGYETSEEWAVAQASFTNNCFINFEGNLDSIAGTSLETILLTKNTTINP